MNPSKNVKVVVFVPESHADIIREVVGNAGAGNIGNYTHCSFSSKGVGRFKPGEGASPYIGDIGKVESVLEERIEFICSRDVVSRVVQRIKESHPYEEVALDIYPLEDLD